MRLTKTNKGLQLLPSTERQRKWFVFWAGGLTQTEAARRAGYSPKVARVMGHRLAKQLTEYGPEYVKLLANELGVSLPRAVKRIGDVLELDVNEHPAEVLRAAEKVAALHGIPLNPAQAVQNRLVQNYMAPVLMITGDEAAREKILNKARKQIESSADAASDDNSG